MAAGYDRSSQRGDLRCSHGSQRQIEADDGPITQASQTRTKPDVTFRGLRTALDLVFWTVRGEGHLRRILKKLFGVLPPQPDSLSAEQRRPEAEARSVTRNGRDC